MEYPVREEHALPRRTDGLATLLQDRIIAYHGAFAHLFGSVNAALLLSQFCWWSGQLEDQDGWFWHTREQIEEETGLSRTEQDTARRLLRDCGVIAEQRRGIPAKLYFRVDFGTLDQLLSAHKVVGKPQRSLQDSCTLGFRIPASSAVGILPTYKKDQEIDRRDPLKREGGVVETTPPAPPVGLVEIAGGSGTEPTSKRRRAAPQPSTGAAGAVDEAFIASMVDRFGMALGSAMAVREAIEAALNHKASDRCKSKQLYVQTWLRREVDFRANRAPGSTAQFGGIKLRPGDRARPLFSPPGADEITESIDTNSKWASHEELEEWYGKEAVQQWSRSKTS